MKRVCAVLALVGLAACEKAAPPPPPPAAASAAPAAPAPAASAALLTPDPAKLGAAAPDSFAVRFTTSRGSFDVKVHRAWAPRGADRLYYLASNGFFDGVRFFRVMAGFMAQFGAHGNPDVARGWDGRSFPDDPVKHSNTRGTLTFATAGPNSRTTQLFINFGNNAQLDGMGFSPMGEVVTGMSVVDSLYSGYGDGPPGGQGPIQGRIGSEGNAYLAREFPKLDSIVTATVTGEWKKK
jgi:peptidyl-prolyl cis-trans isomerase A (cyclophilin A)